MLALQKLKIPQVAINFIILLFTNRLNSVITIFGHTSLYEVQIGIDQSEIILPLLWVIYMNPLLTMLY